MGVRPGSGRDDEIVAACLAGDVERFGDLVRRYEGQVFNVILRCVGVEADARDLAQETFLTAFERLATFRRESAAGTWLCAIALNKSRDFLRRRRLGPQPVDSSAAPAAAVRSPEAAVAAGERDGRVQRALLALPEHYREVLVLKHVEGYGYEEMSRILGLSVTNLKVRTLRARERFKAAYEGAGRERP